MKTLEAKGFFYFEIMILSKLDLSDSFEYLGYGYTTIRNICYSYSAGKRMLKHPYLQMPGLK